MVSSEREYGIPLPKEWGGQVVRIKLSAPELAPLGRVVHFAHHYYDRSSESSTQKVLAVGDGVVCLSEDLGVSWRSWHLSDFDTARLWNGFCLENGSYLVQEFGFDPRRPGWEQFGAGRILLLDPDMNLVSTAQPGRDRWHSPSAIDERDGVLMFAEYPENPSYDDDPAGRRASHVHRSLDGGLTWETVLRLEPGTVRHLHLLRSDPNVPGRWWLFSGDREYESRVWRSDDNGDTWTDLTESFGVPDGVPALRPRTFRLTDIILDEDRMIWGTDDILGEIRNCDPALPLAERAGSRLYTASYPPDGIIEEIGYLGQPARNILPLDSYLLVLTQSYHPTYWLRPSAYLARRDGGGVIKLIDVDRYRPGISGFTYSVASRKPYGGVFFSQRGYGDVFPAPGPLLLRWTVEFE